MVVLEGGDVRRKGGYQNRTSANKGEGGVQILVILWERNNWMTPFCLVWLAEESLDSLISRRS